MIALAATAFVLSLNTNVLAAVMPFVGADIELDEDRRALLVAAAGFGSAFGALLAVALSRRHANRALLGSSLPAFVALSALHLLARSFWPLFALRALSSATVGIAYAAASAAVADLTPYARRGALMGRFNAGMFLAVPVGLPLSVVLARYGHWSWIFAVQALAGVAALVMTRRHVPLAAPSRPTGSWLGVLRDGGVLAVLFATMLHVGSFFTVVQLAGAWLDDEHVVPKGQQVWLWAGLGVLSVVGSASIARLSDRVGKRAFVLVTSAILAGCFLMLAREPGPAALLATGCLLAIAAAARTGPLQALLSGFVPSPQLGALMGLRGFCMQLGVGGFALGAAEAGSRFGFRGVLMLAAGCQVLSYLAIRFGVREPADRAGQGAAPS